MHVSVNGNSTDVADSTTVAALLDDRGIERRGVAVAVNEEVVPKSTWHAAVLAEGDRVELLIAAQGG